MASPTAHHISLNDRTITQDTLTFNQEPSSDAEPSDSERLESTTSSNTPLARKATGTSLRDNLQQQITRQKYARYQPYRYQQDAQNLSAPVEQAEHASTSAPQGVLERGRARAAELLRKKRSLGRCEDRDAVLDILYENQRGSFLFGVPRYSSNSLLQVDPKAWQNADFRTSAVDIRNAQVPDPSWQWAWKSWYVDMSRDVDEEGWEYSFAFPPQFAWHGNHPWFHSFVRRRRWLRRRVRKDTMHKTKQKAHELAPDYFTIHAKVLSAGSQTERGRDSSPPAGEESVEDLTDILALTRYISRARIDREKLVAVRAFIDQGGEDLHYLADRMPEIMSLFIYQSSRRQLLSELSQQHEAIKRRRDSLSGHTHTGDEEAAQTHDTEARKAQNLLDAIAAADAQIQKLEYWSDIKAVVQSEGAVQIESSGHWDKQRWQGVSGRDNNVFQFKQSADDNTTAKLHDEPEKQSKHTKDPSKESNSSEYTTAPSVPPSSSRMSKSPKEDDDTENSLERFVTASEEPGGSSRFKEYRGKHFRGTAREQALQLDGVEEVSRLAEEGDQESKEADIYDGKVHEG